MYLATASEEIRLWTSPDYDKGDVGEAGLKMVRHFNPHHEEVAKIVWSSDNLVLGSTCKSGKSIYLTSLADNGVSSIKLEAGIQNPHHQELETCLCFNSSNRFLLTGSLHGKIGIYDVKKMSMKRSYDPIPTGNSSKLSASCVTFTPDDHCSVSGHQGGEIVFINIRSNQIYSPLYLSGPNATTVAGNGGTIQALRFNRFNRSMLASAHSYGTVALWNTTHRVVSNVMDSHHRGPCMDLTFSPVNEMLLVSAGLDRTIRCYDVLQARQVRCVETENTLLSVSVARDGYSMATGTSNGKVLLYDLRSHEKPFTVLNAHSGPVSEVKFENEPQVSVRSGISDTASSIASDSVRRCSVDSRKPLVEATNVEVSNCNSKLIENVSNDDADEDLNVCSPIFPVDSLNTFNSISGISGVTENSRAAVLSRLAESGDARHMIDFSDCMEGRSSKLQKSVHFDEDKSLPIATPEKVLQDSHEISDFDISIHNRTNDGEESSATEVAGLTPTELSKVAVDLRRDMDKMKQDIDRKLFEWYGKMVWQLCVTEHRIISQTKKMFEDRASLNEEVIRLRKENENLRKNF